MRTLLILSALCLCFLALLPKNAIAQTGKQSGQYKTKSLIPDTSKNEESRIQELFADKLLRENIRYKDGSVLIREFRPSDGSLRSEIHSVPRGDTKTCTYCDDGKTLKRVLTVNGGNVESLYYRKDGKTLWTKEVSSKAGRHFEYFDPSGKLRLKREYPRVGLEMLVTVFDDKGKVAYKQTWVSGVRSYVLTKITEPKASGEQRVIHLRGKRVVSVVYLNADGAVLKTLEGENFQESIDSKWLDEYDRKDDPTAPRIRTRIRHDTPPRNAPVRR